MNQRARRRQLRPRRHASDLGYSGVGVGVGGASGMTRVPMGDQSESPDAYLARTLASYLTPGSTFISLIVSPVSCASQGPALVPYVSLTSRTHPLSPHPWQGASHAMVSNSLLICSRTGAFTVSVWGCGVGTAVGGRGTDLTTKVTVARVETPAEFVAVNVISIVWLVYWDAGAHQTAFNWSGPEKRPGPLQRTDS